MQSLTLKEIYPVQAMRIGKDEARFDSCDAIVEYLSDKVREHSVAAFIGVFDHYTHTKSLPDHAINPDIVDVKIVLFCFGKELPVPEMAAIRPRGIAVVEEKDAFVLSFLDAPNPQAHETMQEWVRSVQKG